MGLLFILVVFMGCHKGKKELLPSEKQVISEEWAGDEIKHHACLEGLRESGWESQNAWVMSSV